MSAKMDRIVKSMTNVLKTADKTPAPYDTQAEVVRVDGDTAWVHIAGGVAETPVRMTINAKAGDTVQVRVSGGSAWLTGNGTAPPTDDQKAIEADTKADVASEAAQQAITEAVRAGEAADSAVAFATQAEQAAGRAETSAKNASDYAARALGNLSTVQSVAETLTWITQHGTMTLTTDTALDPTHVYFVQDANGDYVVGNVHYSVVTEPVLADISTYYELTIDESLNNYVGTHLALTGEGLWLIPEASGGNRILIATGSGQTYTEAGTYIIDEDGDTVAKFGEEVLIGHHHKSYLKLTNRSMASYSKGNTTPFFEVKDLRDDVTNYATVSLPTFRIYEHTVTVSLAIYNVYRNVVVTVKDGVSGTDLTNQCTITIANYALTIDIPNSITINPSFGVLISASLETNSQNAMSFTFGKRASASDASVGMHSSSFGQFNASGGFCSFASGLDNIANGDYSSSFGRHCSAIGESSVALNHWTSANSEHQTAMGRYNAKDTASEYALIIGNGSSDSSRSNAFTVDWDGNTELALNTSAASGTVDGNLYAAITALGWQSEVVE